MAQELAGEISEFLEKYQEGGPWYLVSIGKRGFEGRQFKNSAEAERWAHERNATGANLYFHCNPLKRTPAKGKAKKSDIRASRWLYVDLDPLPGRPVAEERERIWSELNALPEGIPAPTLLLDSGGGFWAFWRLRKHLTVVEGELIGRALEWKIGADHCHNVDRIARLPGTTNWPDAKKRKAGREPGPARVMRAEWSRRYDADAFALVLQEFEEVDRKQPATPKGEGKGKPAADRQPPRRVDSLAELDPWKVPGWLRRIIEDGKGERPKSGDNSRSAWVLDAAQALVKRGVPGDMIQGVLLNAKWRISESVLEHPDPLYYAARQVERARELVGKPAKAKKPAVQRQEGAASRLGPPGGETRVSGAEIDLSDDELALRFGRERLRGRALFVPVWGRWMLWTGTRWEEDKQLRVYTAAREFQRTVAEEAGTRRERKEVLSARMTATLESLARSNPGGAEVAEAWDRDPWLLGTPGGVVDLRTGKTRKPDPGDRITMQTAVEPAPEGADCPLWEECLERWFADKLDVVPFLQRVAGYSLTGSTREHRLFFLFGTGRNGKSVFLDTMAHVLGDYATVSPASTFIENGYEQHSTDLAMLQGARLVVANELPAGKAWNESRIKSLTGGDRITARRMRQDFFTFDPQFTLMIAGNHQPSFGAVDEATKARVVMIHFAQFIPEEERDPRLLDKLREEGPAILRWAINGALAWQREGLQVPGSVLDDSEAYVDAQDEFGEFIETALEPALGASVAAKEVYAVYEGWARERGHMRPWTQRGLMGVMRERGFEFKKTMHGQMLMGWQLQIGASSLVRVA